MESTDVEEKLFRRFNIIWIVALSLLLFSLWTPWWIVSIEVQGFFHQTQSDSALYSPVWSPWILTAIGTKISIHFFKLLVLLMGSIVLVAASRLLLTRKPWLAPPLLWGGSAFCAVGLLFFHIFFPPIALVGDIFWMWGAWEVDMVFVRTIIIHHVWPGFFLALTSLMILIFLAIRLTFGKTYKILIASKERPSPTPTRSLVKSVTRLFVIPISLLLVASGIWVGLSLSPTISADAFMNDWDMTHKSFQPGDNAIVTGTVTNLTVMPTSYGYYTLIGLDDHEYLLALEGDRSSQYPVGSQASIPVHFRRYHYNELEYTWADEGFAPIPFMLMMTVVINAVSYVRGAPLLGDDSHGNGSRLRIYYQHSLPLEYFNITMSRIEGLMYVGESGAIGETPLGVIDTMEALTSGDSPNGTFSFTDANDNGMLDWADVIDFNLPPTLDETHFQTYILNLNGPIGGTSYIVMGNEGPLQFYPERSDKNLPYLFLTMPPDETDGSRCTSRVGIGSWIGEAVSPAEYILRVYEGESLDPYETTADTAWSSLGGDASISFQDGFPVGILEPGDTWLLENLTTGKKYKMRLTHARGGSASVEWFCGIGMNIANYPRVNLSPPEMDPGDPDRLLIAVESVEWVPAGATFDYEVALWKNGSRLLPLEYETAELEPDSPGSDDALPQGPSDDGAKTWIDFVDANGDGYLGAGDYLAVNNTASQSTYELRLYYRHYSTLVATATWVT